MSLHKIHRTSGPITPTEMSLIIPALKDYQLAYFYPNLTKEERYLVAKEIYKNFSPRLSAIKLRILYDQGLIQLGELPSATLQKMNTTKTPKLGSTKQKEISSRMKRRKSLGYTVSSF